MEIGGRRVAIFVATHKKRDGSFVNDEAKNVCDCKPWARLKLMFGLYSRVKKGKALCFLSLGVPKRMEKNWRGWKSILSS
ncbi:uncharacterized protein G2W53_033810 [Senna tora]|uniref:Uncharacterized protein n=1 Tax=Senna tora TaxID=362788 RepID=A0A834TA36_9FABA|nr:uncharacterized protein G2W53_033810 [Senna tora]